MAFEQKREAIPSKLRRFRPLWIGAAAAAILLMIGIPLYREAGAARDPIVLLARAVAEQRPIEGRIASFGYAPSHATERGAEQPGFRVLAAAAEVEGATAGRNDAPSLRARGIAHLMTGRVKDAVGLLERSVAYEATAEGLSDLSAAYLARGREMQQQTDYILAYESAERARAMAPGFAAALFNGALAIEAQGFLTRQAIDAWDAYLKVDATSSWASESRQRRAKLVAIPRPTTSRERRGAIAEAATRRDAAELYALALKWPQDARIHAEETLLVEWARSDSTEERANLSSTLRPIARGLSERGEFWLNDITELVAALSENERSRIASGIIHLAQARSAYRESRLGECVERLNAARAQLEATGFIPLVSLLEASAHFLRRDLAAADIELTRRSGVQAERYPSIAGRANWVDALLSGVKGHPFEAVALLATASELLEKAGELENAAAARALHAQALDLLGEREASWAQQLAAVRDLIQIGSSRQRWHAALYELAETAGRRSAHHTALLISSMLLDAALEDENAERAIDALQVRALAHAGLNQPEAMVRDIREAEERAAAIADPGARERVLLSLGRAAAGALAEHDPDRALRTVRDSLARATKLGDTIGFVQLHLIHGRLLRRLDRLDDAETALREGLTRMVPGSSTADESLRIAHAETAADLIDELTELLVERGESDRAFELLQERRAAELSRQVSSRANERIIPAATRSLEESIALVYAPMKQETVLWLDVAGPRPRRRMYRIPVTRESLQRQVDAFRLSPGDQHLAAGLHRLLIGPVVAELPEGAEISLVASQALHALPFAALWNADRQQYLIERHPLRSAFSLNASSSRNARVASPRSVLVVANPTLPPAVAREFSPLRGAEAEARAIASAYGSAVVLLRANASKERVLREMPDHNVVHVATHGRASARDPGTSALFLAGDPENAVLYARELGTLSLDRVSILVLAACRSAEGKIYSLEGMSGLARAALVAGVDRVVATLGDIPDEASAELFGRFHRELAAGVESAEALRIAQLAMLRSHDKEISAPASWSRVQVFTAFR